MPKEKEEVEEKSYTKEEVIDATRKEIERLEEELSRLEGNKGYEKRFKVIEEDIGKIEGVLKAQNNLLIQLKDNFKMLLNQK